jgi:uncharacterized protein YhfF
VEPPRDPGSLWEAFFAATGTAGTPEAWAFGPASDPALQTELALLAAAGVKRATTSILSDYGDDPLPRPGDHNIVLDGGGGAVCVIRTTAVEIRRFGEVDADFARAEGEGDGTLAYWRTAHIEAFSTQGRRVDDDTQVVLERFAVVWPLSAPTGGCE